MRFALSHSARMIAVGVLSSCDASDVNCRSASKTFSSLSNILSNAPASCFISLGPFFSAILSVRSSASLMELAVATIFSIGLNVLEDIQSAPRNVTMSMTGRIIMVSLRIISEIP